MAACCGSLQGAMPGCTSCACCLPQGAEGQLTVSVAEVLARRALMEQRCEMFVEEIHERRERVLVLAEQLSEVTPRARAAFDNLRALVRLLPGWFMTCHTNTGSCCLHSSCVGSTSCVRCYSDQQLPTEGAPP